MIIRKIFKFEGAHIVRDCSSNRCKKSIHGHGFIVEVKFTADRLDNGGMVMDFGLMKGNIKDIIDSFDHAYSMWTKEKHDFKQFIKTNSERWIEMPCSPTAEMYAVMFFAIVNGIINKTEWNNGEQGVHLSSVRVHETATGWAEAFAEDHFKFWTEAGLSLHDIIFSDGIKNEWKDPELWDKVLEPNFNIQFVNPKVELLYKD